VFEEPFPLLSLSFVAVAGSIILAAASGYGINDYYDVKIDVINKPKEVIIGRSITKKHALVYYFILNTLSLALSSLGGWKVFCIVGGSLFLLWVYANALKRLPFIGNLVVAFLSGLTIVTLIVYNGNYGTEGSLFVVFAFGSTLVREILKDLEDRKGDAQHGCRTLPIVLGVASTKLILYSVIIAYVMASGILSLLVNQQLFLYLSATVGPLYIYSLVTLYRADTKKHFKRLSRISKIIMVIGIFAMLF
jgi:4-hydroxybenzoate polyprenyltransferase